MCDKHERRRGFPKYSRGARRAVILKFRDGPGTDSQV